MSLASGTKLGPYEILAPIGAGGMGEVYKARDSRLDRIVAIKILSGSFIVDADRLRRFEQEARTVAALNHPNILGIHDIGNYDGSPYLVSEFLEGKTLREKLEDGPLPLRRASEYALGIAHGLAAAHEKGIIHRDLKPENIFITNDNRVKILDFGLAKLADSKSLNEVNVTVTSATVPGVVLGTVGYMSPEQVRGEATDARSDIFSCGAVLYEMLTGKRAFKRDTSAETMTAILREEPAELSTSDWHGTPAWERIISRCLEKLPLRRFQSASDLAFAIESLSGSSMSASATSPSGSNIPALQPTRSYLWLIGIAALLLAVAALFIGRSSVKSEPVKFTRLTYNRGFIYNARFVQDGPNIVFSAQFDNIPAQVFNVRPEYPQPVKVDVPSALLLALSPGGELSLSLNSVLHAHFSTGTLAEVPMSGGSPRSILDGVISADYSAGGKSLAITRMVNGKSRLEFPVGKVLYESSGYLDYVRISPSGDTLAFAEHTVQGDDRGFISILDSSGRHKQLTPEFESLQGIAWAPGSNNDIWFTEANSGQARQLLGVDLSGKVREIFHSPDGMTLFDVASNGRVLLASDYSRQEITTVDIATGKAHHGLEWFDGSADPTVSPDGKAILYFEYGGPAGNLYQSVYRKLDGSAPVDLGPGGTSEFSPDGKTVASELLSRPPQIALYPIGAGESRTLSLGGIVTTTDLHWFPDGKRLLIVGAVENETLRSYEMDINGGAPKPAGPPGWLGKAFSPDGKRIAGRLAEDLVIYNAGTQQTQKVTGLEPNEFILAWSADGQGVLVYSEILGGFTVIRIDLATGKRTLVQTFSEDDKAGLFGFHVSLSPDRKTYAYSASRTLSTLYVAEGIK